MYYITHHTIHYLVYIIIHIQKSMKYNMPIINYTEIALDVYTVYFICK